MKNFATELRWAALPFAFIAAIASGVWLWLTASEVAVGHCPPELVWWGMASGNKKCHWPLAVYLAKDMLGAATMAVLAVWLCAITAPARKPAVACAAAAAAAVCALSQLYLRGGDHDQKPAELVFAVGFAFAAAAWLAAWLVGRLVRGQPVTR